MKISIDDKTLIDAPVWVLIILFLIGDILGRAFYDLIVCVASQL